METIILILALAYLICYMITRPILLYLGHREIIFYVKRTGCLKPIFHISKFHISEIEKMIINNLIKLIPVGFEIILICDLIDLFGLNLSYKIYKIVFNIAKNHRYVISRMVNFYFPADGTI